MTPLLAALLLGQGPAFAIEPLPFFAAMKPSFQDNRLQYEQEGRKLVMLARKYTFRVPPHQVSQSLDARLKGKPGWTRSTDTCGGLFYNRRSQLFGEEAISLDTVMSEGTCDVLLTRILDGKLAPGAPIWEQEPLPWLSRLAIQAGDSRGERVFGARTVTVLIRKYEFLASNLKVLAAMAASLKKSSGWRKSTDLCGGVFYDRFVDGKQLEALNYTTATAAGTCDVEYVKVL